MCSPEAPARLQIRADFDDESVVVYQAYNPEIGEAALAAGRFVEPFSLKRMTWIKPSFLWMMERCGWGEKVNQEVVLAVRISRRHWEEALSACVLSSPKAGIYEDKDAWQRAKKNAKGVVQWDPERDILGKKLPWRSIQVGIGKELIEAYAKDWIIEIKDMRPLIRRLKDLIHEGRIEEACGLLPQEKEYPLSAELKRHLGILQDQEDQEKETKR